MAELAKQGSTTPHQPSKEDQGKGLRGFRWPLHLPKPIDPLTTSVQQQIPADVQKEISQFQKKLGQLKTLGYSFKVDKSCCITDSGTRLFNIVAQHKFASVDSAPSIALSEHTNSLIDEPSQFAPKEKSISVLPYHIVADETKHGTTISLYNYADKNNPLIGQFTGSHAAEDVVKCLATFHDKNISTVARQLNSAKPENTGSAYSVINDKQITPAESETIRKTIAKYETELAVQKANSEVDRDKASVKFTLENLNKLENKPLLINGQAKTITFSRELTKQETSAIEKDEQGHLKQSQYKDSYGNIIKQNYRQTSVGTARELISVSFPMALSKNVEEATKPLPLAFDASKYGISELKGMFYRIPEQPIATNGTYAVYSNTNAKSALGNNPQRLSLIYQGAQKAETMFGFAPGSKINSIYITDASCENAYFNEQDNKLITINDEILSGTRAINHTAFHEGAHLIDFLSNRSLSGNELEKEWQRINWSNQKLFDQFNESSFIPNMGNSGHSKDNPKEFFASLTNSLTNPDWENKIKNSDRAFRKEYQNSLVALQSNLDNCPIIPPDAPIRNDIKEKIAFLKELSKRRLFF